MLLITVLHDATGLEVKPSPCKATNKVENILAAKHIVSNERMSILRMRILCHFPSLLPVALDKKLF